MPLELRLSGRLPNRRESGDRSYASNTRFGSEGNPRSSYDF
jgi:hypothetical protein